MTLPTYSNASNARRAARVLADKYDNLQSEPSVLAEDGVTWHAAVSVTIGTAAADVLKVAKVVPHVDTPKAETSPRDKVEALLAKTVANGCTRGEMIAAQQTARALCEKHGLDQRAHTWPDVPEEAPAPQPTPAPEAPKPTRANVRAKKADAPRSGKVSKAARAVEMMSTADGATSETLLAELGWLPHTLRGWVSLQNKAWRKASDGREIVSQRSGKVTTYKVVKPAAK